MRKEGGHVCNIKRNTTSCKKKRFDYSKKWRNSMAIGIHKFVEKKWGQKSLFLGFYYESCDISTHNLLFQVSLSLPQP